MSAGNKANALGVIDAYERGEYGPEPDPQVVAAARVAVEALVARGLEVTVYDYDPAPYYVRMRKGRKESTGLTMVAWDGDEEVVELTLPGKGADGEQAQWLTEWGDEYAEGEGTPEEVARWVEEGPWSESAVVGEGGGLRFEALAAGDGSLVGCRVTDVRTGLSAECVEHKRARVNRDAALAKLEESLTELRPSSVSRAEAEAWLRDALRG